MVIIEPNGELPLLSPATNSFLYPARAPDWPVP